MSNSSPEMPAELRSFLERDGRYLAYSLGNGYNPLIKSALTEVRGDPLKQSLELKGKDCSFTGQFRQLHLSGAITPSTIFLPTLRTAIPCADAIRGFVETLYDFVPAINYISGRRHPLESEREVARLSEVLPGHDRVIVIDELVFSGKTLRNAAGIAQAALASKGYNDTPVTLVPGNWYAYLRDEYNEDPRYDGSYWVDTDAVTLPILAPVMRQVGVAAATVITIEDPKKASDIFYEMTRPHGRA